MQALDVIGDWPVDRAAAAVVRDGRVVDAYGELDGAFALASVTKVLTAYAVLIAVEEEVVSLDEPVGGLPGATVRHLLAHASGLGPEGHALAAPGARRIYSNAGFERLAEIVAGSAGMPFDAYAKQAVAAPLDMTATDLSGSPAAGASSTVTDLALFAGELLAPTLIDPSSLAAATAVAFPGLTGVLPGFGRQDPNDWGLGFELRDHKSPHWTGRHNAPGTFGHFGQSGTFLWVDPRPATALVCLTDRPFGPWAAEAWPALADHVLDATSA